MIRSLIQDHQDLHMQLSRPDLAKAQTELSSITKSDTMTEILWKTMTNTSITQIDNQRSMTLLGQRYASLILTRGKRF